MIDLAVNLLWCVPNDVGGSEQYLVRQLVGLSELEHDYRVRVYAPTGFVRAHPALDSAFEVVEAPIDGRDRARRVLAEHTWLARRTRSAGLVHHGGGTVPALGGRPVVLTIHDLQWLTYPGYVRPVKLRYLRRQLPRSIHRSSVVTVPSSYVRSTVVDAYDIDPDRVVVVRHGIEPDLGAERTPEDRLRAWYGLGDGPVLVLPAVTHPHKRHDFVLDLLVGPWADADVRVVFIGGTGHAEGAVAARLADPRLRGRVVRPGRVSTADRDGLIAMADALVFPSEYEGFGAPVLEAMALGTPVIASDRTALPEVVGDAGLCLPLDLDAWAGALDEMHARRSELVAAGLARVPAFTAARSAGDLLNAYRLARS